MADFQIRTSDVEAGELLRHLADKDMRSMGNEVAWLIRQEYARRYSQPNPVITIEQACAAALAVATGEDDSIVYPTRAE